VQEIQFLEFMGGCNLPQASPNCLICMCFIRISTVVPYCHFIIVWVTEFVLCYIVSFLLSNTSYELMGDWGNQCFCWLAKG